tara:strand:+ start:45 stop:185 length:141 start_codon:yes stop_codon:yes gene_type:complete
MNTKEINGIKFKVDEKWDEVRDNKNLQKKPVAKKGIFKKLIDFIAK